MSRREWLTSKCENCPLLHRTWVEDLSHGDLARFSSRTTLHVYARGEPILRQGDPMKGLWILRRGMASIHVTDRDGRAHIVRLAAPGEVLGTCGGNPARTYCYGATALQDQVYVCHVPLDSDLSLISEYPAVTGALIAAAGDELASSYRKMHVMATRNAAGRLAMLLLELDRLDDVELSRQQMAEMIGVTTETAVRTLTAFKQEGLIRSVGRHIQILAPESLREIAEAATPEDRNTLPCLPQKVQNS